MAKRKITYQAKYKSGDLVCTSPNEIIDLIQQDKIEIEITHKTEYSDGTEVLGINIIANPLSIIRATSSK